MTLPQDRICVCGHWSEEHAAGGCDGCDGSPDFTCDAFKDDPEQNTPQAIIDRSDVPHAAVCRCALCLVRNAAPALLEALEGLLHAPLVAFKGDDKQVDPAYEAAHRALALARGEGVEA